jgi:mono/diheme cytochrome c family protein
MRHYSAILAIIAGLFLNTGPISAQEMLTEATPAVDLGKLEFEKNCAICHGLQAHGDGPYASRLTAGVPDLTVLSQKNGGAFPFERVYQIIDGTQMLAGHGTRQMPIWGQVYTYRAEENYFTWRAFPWDAQAFVRARILALTEYIARLQRTTP